MKKNKKKKQVKKKQDSLILELKKEFPLADSISIHGLYLAIKRGYRIYLTYDPNLNSASKAVMEKFKIEIFNSVDSLPETAKQELYQKINPMYAAERESNGF